MVVYRYTSWSFRGIRHGHLEVYVMVIRGIRHGRLEVYIMVI